MSWEVAKALRQSLATASLIALPPVALSTVGYLPSATIQPVVHMGDLYVLRSRHNPSRAERILFRTEHQSTDRELIFPPPLVGDSSLVEMFRHSCAAIAFGTMSTSLRYPQRAQAGTLYGHRCPDLLCTNLRVAPARSERQQRAGALLGDDPAGILNGLRRNNDPIDVVMRSIGRAGSDRRTLQ